MKKAMLRASPAPLVLAVVLAACSGRFPWSMHIPAEVRAPSIAGVVEESTQLPNGQWEYRLSNGQTLEVDYDRATSLLGGPSLGRLLLAGEDPDGRQWVAGVSLSTAGGRPPGCFDFPAQGRDNDGWIETTSGFRLKKAHDFSDWRNPKSDEYI